MAVIWCPPHAVLALASDSRSARKWARAGLSPSAYANKIVSMISEIANEKQVRMAIAWIKSEKNLSDGCSRDYRLEGARDMPWQNPDEEFRVTAWL